ncbi:MAG: PEP-CTERM sorting domain-containing protein [Verrucomicrobiota bacterium]
MKFITHKICCLAAIAFAAAAISARAQQIPLYLETIDNQQRLVIYLGINNLQNTQGNNVVHRYLFDTGSSGFNAAYYTGADATNSSKWGYSSTVSSNATISYATANYTLNAVTVPSIQVYHKTSFATPAFNLLSNASNPGSTGYTIGAITDTTFPLNSSYSTFQDALQAGAAPLASGLYGTFGAGMFTGENHSGTASFVVGSVLGQSTDTGWAVVANTGAAHPYAILGLTGSIAQQFDSRVSWNSQGTHPYPNHPDGTPFYGGTEFDTNFDFSVTDGSVLPVTWSTPTLLDTGTAGNAIFDPAAYTSLNADGLINGAGRIPSGSQFEATGATAGDGTYLFTTDNNYFVDGTQVHTREITPNDFTTNGGTGPAGTTLGINFFLNNSVAFDLANQQTLYTAAVVVPEPSTCALSALGILGSILAYRRRVAAA